MNKGQKERMIAELERIAVALEKIVSFADRFGSHAANTSTPAPKTLPEPSPAPAADKSSDDFHLENEDIVRKERASQLKPVLSISETNLLRFAKIGVVPATRKGDFLYFSAEEVAQTIKRDYAVQKEYIPGNRIHFLHSIKIAKRTLPNSIFVKQAHVADITRIATSTLSAWRECGLRYYKLPSAAPSISTGVRDSSSSVLLNLDDVIDFLQKGGQA